MTLASITRMPDRDTGGMRSTAGQDRVVEAAGGWRRDRRTWWVAAALIVALLAAAAVAASSSVATMSSLPPELSAMWRGERQR